MKPFHTQTRYFSAGPYRWQITCRHIHGPHWDGTPCPEAKANMFVWKPEIYKQEQNFRGFITKTFGLCWGMFVVSLDICDTRG